VGFFIYFLICNISVIGGQKQTIMTENEISYLIRGAIFKVYNTLGAGLFESVYSPVLKYELERLGLKVKTEVAIPLIYDNLNFDIGFRLDLLVNDKVIIELKSVEKLNEVHFKQLITYLKITNLKLGLLINFNTDNIATSIFRKVNNL
jgi:GxxExxY protein